MAAMTAIHSVSSVALRVDIAPAYRRPGRPEGPRRRRLFDVAEGSQDLGLLGRGGSVSTRVMPAWSAVEALSQDAEEGGSSVRLGGEGHLIAR